MSDLVTRIANLSPEKRALFERTRKEKESAGLKETRITARGNTCDLLLSFAQQRMWFLDQLERESSFYNITSFFRITGSLDVSILSQSLNAIVSRHEILRTTFESKEGEPFQVIKPFVEIALSVIDISKFDENNRESEVRRLANEELQKPFSLSVGPLIRCTLLCLDNNDHIMSLTMHHIISDGWSMGIFKMELNAFYNDFVAGRKPFLDVLPIQYADFAQWQRQWLKSEVLEKQLSYWRKQLEGAPLLLELPIDQPRPAIQSYAGSKESIILPCKLIESIKILSCSQGSTPFMTMLTAFNILLYKYTGVDDLLVGTPIANRTRVEIENLIGFFVNTLVLRSDLSGDPSFCKLLHRVREVALEAYDHQDLPFEKLVEAVQPERNLSYSPLFQVLFAYQNVPAVSLKMSDLTLTTVEFDSKISKFDLSLFINETDEGLEALMEYNTDLFSSVTIKRMLSCFETLLGNIIIDPHSRISNLQIQSKGECDQMLQAWNNTKTDYPHDKCIHQLFELQAEKSPDSIALVYKNTQLTYKELNNRANQLACFLGECGVKPNVLVGICLERSIDMMIGILGILKAGGVYVPLDPTSPNERLAFMLQDAKVSVLLTEECFVGKFHDGSVRLICLDREKEKIINYGIENLPNLSSSADIAYIMYTSGSTGIPKGVEVPHRGVVRLLFGADYVALGIDETFLQLAPISFDASTFEIWGALLHGSKCVLFSERVPTPEDLANVIKEEDVTVLWLTSSLFNSVIDEGPEALSTIKQLLIGGEALSVSHVRRALDPFAFYTDY